MALVYVPMDVDGTTDRRRPRRAERQRDVSRRDCRSRVQHADRPGCVPVRVGIQAPLRCHGPDPPRTLEDGTIRRYDNSHERTKGHELHVAPDPEPNRIEFPGMVGLRERFWNEIPKSESFLG